MTTSSTPHENDNGTTDERSYLLEEQNKENKDDASSSNKTNGKKQKNKVTDQLMRKNSGIFRKKWEKVINFLPEISSVMSSSSSSHGDHPHQRERIVSKDEIIHKKLNTSDDTITTSTAVPAASFHAMKIGCILSTSFAYGFIMTTLFMISLPLECIRMDFTLFPSPHKQTSTTENNNSSIILGIYIFFAGLCQLTSPIIGMMSDKSTPLYPWGKRRPFLLFGGIFVVLSTFILTHASVLGRWYLYFFSFMILMIGMNVVYSVMIAFIPDLIPSHQVGQANGILAFQVVSGSLAGFVVFHYYDDVEMMYGIYIVVMTITVVITCLVAREETISPSADQQQQLVENGDDAQEHPRQDNRGVVNFLYLTFTSWYEILSTSFQNLATISKSELGDAFTLSKTDNHDFFYCTISRTMYYMGISVQTFFLYYIHDKFHPSSNPETIVSKMAVMAQLSGLIICYPIGLISDYLKIRKMFVYVSCTLLALGCAAMVSRYTSTLTRVYYVVLVLGCGNGVYLTMETSLAVNSLSVDNRNRLEQQQEHQYHLLQEGEIEEAMTIASSSSHEELPHVVEEEGEQHCAQLLGIWGVAGFIGSALGPLVGGPVLFIFGQFHLYLKGMDAPEGKEEEEEYDTYYGMLGYMVLFALSAMYFCLSAFVLQRVESR